MLENISIIVKDVGFPIFCAIFLLVFYHKENIKNIETNMIQTSAIEKLEKLFVFFGKELSEIKRKIEDCPNRRGEKKNG